VSSRAKPRDPGSFTVRNSSTPLRAREAEHFGSFSLTALTPPRIGGRNAKKKESQEYSAPHALSEVEVPCIEKDPGSLGFARDDTKTATDKTGTKDRNERQKRKTGKKNGKEKRERKNRNRRNEILTGGRSTGVAVEAEARLAAANLGDSIPDLWRDRQVRERVDECLQSGRSLLRVFTGADA
jgi:hypothetical protein